MIAIAPVQSTAPKAFRFQGIPLRFMPRNHSPQEHPARQPAPPPEFAVEAVGLNKVYRARGRRPGKAALIDVNLAIPRGSLFGLLGVETLLDGSLLNAVGPSC